MTNEEIIRKIGEELLTEGPNVPPTEITVRAGSISLSANTPYIAGDKIFIYELNEGQSKLTEKETAFTAEEWISSEGFSSIRLITLLDLEKRLSDASKSSTNLQAVRTWMNAILMAYMQNPAPKADWLSAPFSFDETVQDIFNALAA
jgi:hypothetical protein